MNDRRNAQVIILNFHLFATGLTIQHEQIPQKVIDKNLKPYLQQSSGVEGVETVMLVKRTNDNESGHNP